MATAQDIDTNVEFERAWEVARCEALNILDRALSTMTGRELVSTDEVRDALLDMRSPLQHVSELAVSAATKV